MSLTDWVIFAVVFVAMIALVHGSRVPSPPEASDESSDRAIPDVPDGNFGSSGKDDADGD